jgi:hypothetical protein
MYAGTSIIRTSIASTSTATVSPNPNNRITDTCAAVSAANEITMIEGRSRDHPTGVGDAARDALVARAPTTV